MIEKSSRGFQGNYVGGSIGGSFVGSGNQGVTIIHGGETRAASLGDLRKEIALLRAEVEVVSGAELADSPVRYEFKTIEQELREDEPDGEAVRIRWKQVQKLLGPLQHVASIAQATERVLTLVRALFGGN